MYTPRPDRFTYPLHGDPLPDTAATPHQGEVRARKPWMKAVFAGGLIGVVVLSFALSLAR